MNILLTGASGFIGGYLQNSRGLDIHRSVSRNVLSHSREQFNIDSINSSTNWKGAFEGVKVVIHLAGLAHKKTFTKEQYQKVNVEGSLHLASEAFKAGVKRFVFVSSIGVNGTSTSVNPFSLESIPQPHNPFAESKYNAEIGLKRIADETGLEVVIVRPTLVYGPNAPGNFRLLTKLVAKLPILPFGLANNNRDFIALQNLADLLVTCANHPDAAGHVFLASDGKSVSTKEFTNALAKGLNKSIIQLPIPNSFMRLCAKFIGKSEMVEQLLSNLEVDSSNAQAVLGWTPPYTMKQAMSLLSKIRE